MHLTARSIALAALDLAEAEGAERLTMRSIASRLHRRPSSLYNHISGREDLIEHMRAIIVEDIEVAAFTQEPWDVALGQWAKSYLNAFAMRPNCIRLLATTPITDPATLAMYDVVVTALVQGGWPQEQAIAVMRTVEAHVLGSALDVIAPENLLSPDAVSPDLDSLRRSLDPAHFSSWSAQAAFALGIQALIDGLRARLPRIVAAQKH
ncbi:MAG TPA: TetR/AcrR family transcriptional regulator C-terminal domain-containing protein [Homoserinimonas sp.]|nr:TetR/AcrR family transcriptional regulator C-terminal domain-containing protein [Homoserinimonas sp.]